MLLGQVEEITKLKSELEESAAALAENKKSLETAQGSAGDVAQVRQLEDRSTGPKMPQLLQELEDLTNWKSGVLSKLRAVGSKAWDPPTAIMDHGHTLSFPVSRGKIVHFRSVVPRCTIMQPSCSHHAAIVQGASLPLCFLGWCVCPEERLQRAQGTGWHHIRRTAELLDTAVGGSMPGS